MFINTIKSKLIIVRMENKLNNGLGCVETGSQSYLSGLLGFDDFEKEDYDNNTEQDLKVLGIEHKDLQSEIKNFFKQEQTNERFKAYLSILDKQAEKEIIFILSN